MSQCSPRITRKRYLNKDEPFVLPQSTAYWKKQRERRSRDSQPCAAESSGEAEASSSACESAGSPDCVSPNPCLGATGDVRSRDSSSADLADEDGELVDEDDALVADDSFVDYGEADVSDAEILEGTEHVPSANSDDEVLSDCSESFESETSDGETGEEAADPRCTLLDESELLASEFAEFGSETLPGSPTTKVAAIIMIMAFVITHGLSWVALDDLLGLIDGLFGFKGNTLPRSKHLFRKMWSSRTRSLVKYFFYCDVCGSLLKSEQGSSTLMCTTCAVSTDASVLKTKGNFFIILALKEQLKSLVARMKDVLFSRLNHLKELSNQTPMSFNDITCGLMFNKLRQSGKTNWMDLTLTFNTDGSPVFKSSASSIWPIQFLVNELPHAYRIKNCLVAGLWFGRHHPDMSLFMGKFVEEVNNFGHLIWRVGSSVMKSAVHAICCCVDAPARAAVMNMVQFNGMFGCPWCYACAEHLEGGQRYMSVVADEQRTPNGMLRDMKFAIEVGEPVNGLKGPSPLASLPSFNVVFGHTVEYMHCILLGVTKCFTDAWFETSNSQEPYYIGRPATLAQVDKRLLSIKPPQCFTRLPRSLKERCHWKASEWRHWLLFYAVPCCTGILPQRHLNHFILLVEAVHMLLLEELTSLQLQRAGRLLQEFVSRTKTLYSPRMMTFNLHQLLHIVSAVEHFGPLWAHCAFVFESGNGRLLKTITGAKAVPNQVVERLVMLEQLHLLTKLGSFEEKVKEFTSSLLGYPKTVAVACVDTLSFFGNSDPVPKLTPEEVAALQSVGVPVGAVYEHFRFLFKGTIVHSRHYKRARKSDGSVVRTTENEYFVIERIFEVAQDSLHSVDKIIFLCKRIVCIESHDKLPVHIKECFLSLVTVPSPLKVRDIDAPCLLIEFPADEKMYVCDLPNSVERD